MRTDLFAFKAPHNAIGPESSFVLPVRAKLDEEKLN